MRTTGFLRAHYMHLGAASAICGIPTKRVLLAYDEWAKVTCSDCLASRPASTTGSEQ